MEYGFGNRVEEAVSPSRFSQDWNYVPSGTNIRNNVAEDRFKA